MGQSLFPTCPIKDFPSDAAAAASSLVIPSDHCCLNPDIHQATTLPFVVCRRRSFGGLLCRDQDTVVSDRLWTVRWLHCPHPGSGERQFSAAVSQPMRFNAVPLDSNTSTALIRSPSYNGGHGHVCALSAAPECQNGIPVRLSELLQLNKGHLDNTARYLIGQQQQPARHVVAAIRCNTVHRPVICFTEDGIVN